MYRAREGYDAAQGKWRSISGPNSDEFLKKRKRLCQEYGTPPPKRMVPDTFNTPDVVRVRESLKKSSSVNEDIYLNVFYKVTPNGNIANCIHINIFQKEIDTRNYPLCVSLPY
jgi:hypothetical protein